jgi:hypothetical protein
MAHVGLHHVEAEIGDHRRSSAMPRSLAATCAFRSAMFWSGLRQG